MKRIIPIILFVFFVATPVSAMEFTAPEVPEEAQEYVPEDTESFGEGVWYVIKSAVSALQPSIAEASRVCLSLIAVIILVSLLQNFSGSTKPIVELVGTLTISVLLIEPTNSLIQLGARTVVELSEYGKMLLPVMTAAMAAQGWTTSSASLYTGTVFFDSVLSSAISKLIIPMLYVYLCLCVANSTIGEEILKKLRDFVKWALTWCLKIVLYIFIGYIGISGVVSGTTDAAAVKAAKLAISGSVPVVGSIISDASEAVLVSAGVMKNSVGISGLLVIIALWIGPFLRIGVQYLLLKITAAVCGVFGTSRSAGLIQDFSDAMGLVLAMIGTVCLLLLISTVCFMKGAA